MVKQLHRKHLTHGAVTELVALQIEGEYDFTDEAVMARAVKICKRSARDTKKILRRLVSYMTIVIANRRDSRK